jgi:1,4-alpha-glucan branching enzyme
MPPYILRPFLFCLVCIALAAAVTASASGEEYMPKPYVKLEHPEWSRNAVIYQINTRQFTAEGTFEAAAAHLPRLKALGVDILWLMPVQEIGRKNRKGSLGSPYAIRDYKSVNPEFGGPDDLKRFIAEAHEQGLYVILDWVANHTAWDNPLLEAHPDWYRRDLEGGFYPPAWTDWSDVVQLDYSQPGLRQYMAEAMKWWVTEIGMDGFRCDVAGFVPLDFWDAVRAELDAIRPVFMLAEWNTRDLHARAFDMTYAWDWYDTLHDIAMGRADVTALAAYHYTDENSWPRDAIRMLFVSNHDKNSWDGTQFEAFGDALENAIALSVVSRGMPLIYNGQEAGNPKRLEFFEKDPIEWRDHPVGEQYRELIALKKRNTALWNGHWGAPMVQVPNSEPTAILSFLRANDRNRLFGVFNLSAKTQTVRFDGRLHHGSYRAVAGGDEIAVDGDFSLTLPPWSYRLFER